MNEELIFRIVFWVLCGILFVIRGISALKVRQAGERILPDKQAIKREGKVIIILRAILFVSLIAFLVLYSINPPFMNVLWFYLPIWLRWLGVFVGVISLLLWAWSQATLDKYWSPQLQLRHEHKLVTKGPYKKYAILFIQQYLVG